MKHKLLFTIFLILLAIPLVAAEMSIQCPNTPINPGGSINCVVRTDTALSNVGTVQFTLVPGDLFTLTGVTGLAGVNFNPANGVGTYTNAQGINFAANSIIFQVNLEARSSASGSGSISFSRFVVRDVNTVVINTGSLARSNQITVGGPSCGPGETSCRLGCADLNTNRANCGVCDRPCGPAQSCQAGVCQDAQQLPRCSPSNLNLCATGPDCTAAGGRFNSASGRCAAQLGQCADEAPVINCNCPAETHDVVNGKCTKLLQNIKTEIESGEPRLNILARIAALFRSLFEGLFS